MLELPIPVPARRRRRTRWGRVRGRLPRIGARRVVAGAVLLAALVAVAWVVHRARRPDPRAELAMSARTLAAGNFSAARRHAQVALAATAPAARRDLAAAHLAVARADLALGEGVAAEGELGRAAAAGAEAPAAMLAEARLLGGDAAGAVALADRAAPRDAAYAARIAARARALDGDVPAARAGLVAALARAPRDSAAWRDLARVRFDAGDVGGASDALGRALALTRADPDALALAGEVVRARYGPSAALPWFDAALARDAYYLPALLGRAATLGDLGRYAEMLDATRRALAARPGEPRALYLQAVLAARAGRRDLARALLARTGGRLAGEPGVLLLGGVLDAGGGRQEAAIGQFRALVGQQPFNIVARRLLAAALLRSGDARGALDVIRPVAQRADADGYSLALAGRAFEATGRRDMAATLLDRAANPRPGPSAPFGSDDAVAALVQGVGGDPADPARAVELVRGLVEAGRIDEARARARALAAAGPGAPEAWLLAGDVDAVANRPADAARAYARAADLRFDRPALLRLVDAWARAGQAAEAARALALFRAQDPADPVAARLVADLQLRAGRWAAAIDALEGLRARTGSRDPLLLASLSAAYLGAGDAAAARDLARAAYRLQPMGAGAADAYGWALYALGDDAGARALLAKAAALAPGDPAVRAHVAALAGH